MNTATTPDKTSDARWQLWAEHEAAALNREQPPLFEPAMERLRKQRDELNQRGTFHAKADGMQWAQWSADFDDLRKITSADFGSDEDLTARCIVDEIGCDVEATFGLPESELTPAYLEGWLEGVQIVFNAI